jgi:hypothetical protein
MIVYLVWSRDGRSWVCESDGWRPRRATAAYEPAITYRDWRDVVRDVQAALRQGREIRIARATVSRATWRTFAPPSAAQVRRLRGTRQAPNGEGR